jgi:hypothetical protein
MNYHFIFISLKHPFIISWLKLLYGSLAIRHLILLVPFHTANVFGIEYDKFPQMLKIPDSPGKQSETFTIPM